MSEGQIAEKQGDIETLEAELVGVREDLRTAGGQIAELESTNQLLKVGWQCSAVVGKIYYLRKCF